MVAARRKLLLPILLALSISSCIIWTAQIQEAVPSPVGRVEAVSSEAVTLHSQPSTRSSSNSSQYWSLAVSERGQNVDCKIAPQQATPYADNLARYVDNKIMIHIHGLHHSGTGYLRKTLIDSLNHEFSSLEEQEVACMQDSLLPYRHLYQNKTKLYRNHYKGEDEGQHLQTIYPSFQRRVGSFKEAKSEFFGQFPKTAYLADYCLSNDATENKRIGNILLGQWSRYWNVTSSTKFLLQKNPTIDVQFLESTKILPTLHIIIVRHPMTSNSWLVPNMGYGWAMAYHHVLKLLNEGKVEWYALVSYEALLEYRDVVVEELMEVVRSGMKRFGVTSSFATQQEPNMYAFRRQLHLHGASGINPKKGGNLWLAAPSNSYLTPPQKSVERWRTCLAQSRCRQILDSLTTDIFPLFGYVSIQKSNASLVNRINAGNDTISKNAPLAVDPSIVTVAKEYGRVLFSSESDALKLLRKRNGSSERDRAEGPEYIGQSPPTDLIVKMAELLEKFAAKPPEGTPVA